MWGTCRFITCFVTLFATVIAITKDLADVEGDRKYGIETFSTRLGTRRVAFLGARQLPLCKTLFLIVCTSWRDCPTSLALSEDAPIGCSL